MKIIPIHTENIFKFKNEPIPGRTCLEPFGTINIANNGDVGMCSCTGWMPTVIGNIFHNTVEELLNSDLAKDIRNSIRNGTFEYCDFSRCGMVSNDMLPHIDELSSGNQTIASPAWVLHKDEEADKIPITIFIAGDNTCNLSCPSCRTQVLNNSEESQFNNLEVFDKLNKQLFNSTSEKAIDIKLSTSGEVFASPLLLSFLSNFPIDRYPNIFVTLQTNGLLLSKRWHKIKNIEHKINNVTVTTDSGIKDVYEKLRRGGNFENLLHNLNFLKDLKDKLNFELCIRMVIQNDNCDEIETFYHWAKSFGADIIEYTRIVNWGTYTPSDFKMIDVLNPSHAKYNDTVNKIKKLKSLGCDILTYGFNIS